MKLIIASNNKHKIYEIKKILGSRFSEILSLSEAGIVHETVEDGIRFLTDHINGDTYYHIDYPGQNLDRARTQLKLLSDMEDKLPKIRDILQKIYDELGLDAKVI